MHSLRLEGAGHVERGVEGSSLRLIHSRRPRAKGALAGVRLSVGRRG